MSFIEQKAREWARPILEAAGRTLARWHVSPDWVTNLGLLLTIGVGILAGLGQIRWAGGAYIFAAACDALDGALARASGKGSRFGAFLDSTIDRFEESIVFLGLAIYYAQLGGRWETPAILGATIGSLMVSYTRARAEAVGVSCREGLMTRPVRVVVMIAGLLLDQAPIAAAVVAVAGLLTACGRMYQVWKLTGGEDAGWALPREPFSTPGFGVQKEENREDTP